VSSCHGEPPAGSLPAIIELLFGCSIEDIIMSSLLPIPRDGQGCGPSIVPVPRRRAGGSRRPLRRIWRGGGERDKI
jgi:hypothetical protein